jgi:hypothetical protein
MINIEEKILVSPQCVKITCMILTVPELHGYPGNNALRNIKKM